MQFGHALDCILHEILLANPAFGPVQLIKVDIDGFYCVDLNIDEIPKHTANRKLLNTSLTLECKGGLREVPVPISLPYTP